MSQPPKGRLRAAGPYPYVVIRWMAAVYGRAEIVFSTQGPSAKDPPGLISVLDPTPTAETMTPARIEALREAVLARSAATGFRMCLVLGPEESIFVTPDGKMHTSTQAPEGGVRIDAVEIAGDESE